MSGAALWAVSLVGLFANIIPLVTVSAVAAVLMATVLAGVRQQQHGRLETVET